MEKIEWKSLSYLFKKNQIRKYIEGKVGALEVKSAYTRNNKIIVDFQDSEPRYNMEIERDCVMLYEVTQEYIKRIKIPNKPIITVDILERAICGVVYRSTERIYRSTKELTRRKEMVSLVEKSYVFTDRAIDAFFLKKDIQWMKLFKFFNSYIDDNLSLEVFSQFNSCIHLTNTNSHIKFFVDSKEYSYLYSSVKGKKVLDRIYDLYRGEITYLIKDDIDSIRNKTLSTRAYDLKTLLGITKKEEELVGILYYEKPEKFYEYIYDLIYNQNKYPYSIDFSNRESVLSALLYDPLKDTINNPQNKKK